MCVMRVYLLKKNIGDSIIEEDLDKIEFCYIYLSEYKDGYMMSLRLCKEK